MAFQGVDFYNVDSLLSDEERMIRDTVRAWVESQGIRDGVVTVTTPHTTARIVVNERDAALQRDMLRHLQ